MIPHATQIATKGFLGATIGLSSKGYIIRITEVPILIEKEYTAGRKSFEEARKKKVKICVEAYGKKFCQEKIISFDHKITVKDLEIIELGDEEISIIVKGPK